MSLSSVDAGPAIYVAGTSGKAADQQGRLIKLTNLTGTPTSAFSDTISPDAGSAAAKATAIDGNGNVYVVGNTNGSFGSEINQATQDVFLTKYDSAGNVQWTNVFGTFNLDAVLSVAVDENGRAFPFAGPGTNFRMIQDLGQLHEDPRGGYAWWSFESNPGVTAGSGGGVWRWP